MGTKTGIEWTDATWNPIIGCSRVSEGCRNCYAEGIAARFGNGKPTVYSGLTQIVNGHPQWTGVIKETRQMLQPLSWKKPKRVFVNSMSDLFHENVTDEQRDRVFAVMALCQMHTFQILTKRPRAMLEYMSSRAKEFKYWKQSVPDGWSLEWMDMPLIPFPLPNIWLGVSVENQAAADERIPILLKTPAAKRFLSCEPLLGPVSLRWKDSGWGIPHPRHLYPVPNEEGSVVTDEYDGLRELDWVIVGGESGPHARPMHPSWARTLRDQCQAARVPFFFKQHGEWISLCDYDFVVLGANAERYEHQFTWKMGVKCEDELPISCYRVGKKAAGALLDGVEYKQFPQENQ